MSQKRIPLNELFIYFVLCFLTKNIVYPITINLYIILLKKFQRFKTYGVFLK